MSFQNTELIKLYWEIGLEIVQRQKEEGWGTKVIDKLTKDLKASFPQMAGFSPCNLFLYEAIRRSLSRIFNFAASCCKNPLESQHGLH